MALNNGLQCDILLLYTAQKTREGKPAPALAGCAEAMQNPGWDRGQQDQGEMTGSY